MCRLGLTQYLNTAEDPSNLIPELAKGAFSKVSITQNRRAPQYLVPKDVVSNKGGQSSLDECRQPDEQWNKLASRIDLVHILEVVPDQYQLNRQYRIHDVDGAPACYKQVQCEVNASADKTPLL